MKKQMDYELLHEALPKEITGERLQGKISFYDESKGYGFIQCASDSFFFHISNINGVINKYDKVSFVIGQDRKGRSMAVAVQRLEEK